MKTMNSMNWKSNFEGNEEKGEIERSPLVRATIEYVKRELKGRDASHDYDHIERVWRLSQRLAKKENCARTEMIEIGSLLHDIEDWKYKSSEPNKEGPSIKLFLQSQGVQEETISAITKIISSIGYKDELQGQFSRTDPYWLEYACIQDADRLDAIGAIGIARCFTYGGHKQRALYDKAIPPIEEISHEEYIKQHSKQSPTINHFYEKLLKLKNAMKTETGKRMAEERHHFMESFLENFFREIRAESTEENGEN